MKKAGHQVDYDKDDDFSALVRRISALPFTKPADLDEAFEKYRERAGKLNKKLEAFSNELIDYAQVQWRYSHLKHMGHACEVCKILV